MSCTRTHKHASCIFVCITSCSGDISQAACVWCVELSACGALLFRLCATLSRAYVYMYIHTRTNMRSLHQQSLSLSRSLSFARAAAHILGGGGDNALFSSGLPTHVPSPNTKPRYVHITYAVFHPRGMLRKYLADSFQRVLSFDASMAQQCHTIPTFLSYLRTLANHTRTKPPPTPHKRPTPLHEWGRG